MSTHSSAHFDFEEFDALCASALGEVEAHSEPKVEVQEDSIKEMTPSQKAMEFLLKTEGLAA